MILLEVVMVSHGTHENHESQFRAIRVSVQKTTSFTLKMLRYNVLKQAVRESEINAIIVLTTKVRGLKFKQQPHKSHKQNFVQRHLQMDRSIFASYGMHPLNYFEVAKSLQFTDAGPHFNASS